MEQEKSPNVSDRMTAPLEKFRHLLTPLDLGFTTLKVPDLSLRFGLSLGGGLLWKLFWFVGFFPHETISEPRHHGLDAHGP
jgi:hypothetical protein